MYCKMFTTITADVEVLHVWQPYMIHFTETVDMAKVEDLFAAADTDGSGSMDKDEFMAMMDSYWGAVRAPVRPWTVALLLLHCISS